MKTVTFNKRFRRRIDESTYQEWPAGAVDTVSNEVAKQAQEAGVLDGEPVDAPKSGEGEQPPAKKA